MIDGLDECNGSGERTQILQYIRELVLQHRLPLRFLVVSRPEPDIRHAFSGSELRGTTTLLSLYGDHLASRDVCAYLRAGFDEICQSEGHSSVMALMPEPWPNDDVVQLLAGRSEGYFIYASTVLKYVGEEYGSCVDRLREVVEQSESSSPATFAELDNLYRQILSTSSDKRLLLRILGFLVVPGGGLGLRAPSLEMTEILFDLQPGLALLTLRGMYSVLQIRLHPKRLNNGVTPIHASFREFLLDEARAGPYFLDRWKCNEDTIRCIFTVFRDWDKYKARYLCHSILILSSLTLNLP